MESLLGLEFIEDKIKILEIYATERGLELTRLAKIDLPAASIKDGVIVEPRVVSERLTAFIKTNNITTKKAITLLNPSFAFTRLIRLPYNLSDSQIHLNLEAELNQYRIFMDRETVIDFKKLEEISEEGIKKVNVLFIATFRQLSESYLKALELSGLDLIGIDTSLLCIMRALDEVDLKSSSLEVALLMLIGQKYLEMCIVKGNRQRFLHSVEIDALDLDKNKADFIDRIVSAIKLMLNFYQTRFVQGEEITRIIVNPLETKYNQIHTSLQEKLPQIPIQLSSPLNKIYVDKEKFKDWDELRFDFSCLIGATLRLRDKTPAFNLNLLLEQKAQRQYRLAQMYLLFISLTFILSIILISLVWVILKINILQSRISYLKSQIEQPSRELNKAVAIKEKKDVLEKQINETALIINKLKRSFYCKNISKAMVLVPQNLWLTDITLEEQNKNLILSGESNTEKPIFDYLSSLSNSGNFDSVELVSSKGETENIKFVIRCQTKQ